MDIVVPVFGVGGLSYKYEIKILICYLLHSVKTPLSFEELAMIFQEEGAVNYFSFCEAFKELTVSGHLLSGEKSHYTLGPLGTETAMRLARSLPQSLRDNVVGTAMKLLARLKRERENHVEILPTDGGFRVCCSSHDGDFELMRLELYAPDELQAQRIKTRFLQNPAGIYQNIIGFLTEE